MEESRFYHIRKLQRFYNKRNKEKLINKNVSLICSNCTGGIMYHWLGLKFSSPFINLYMDTEDYLSALEDFDAFLNSPIECEHNSGKAYPVGRSTHKGQLLHFMHYKSFEEAIGKWDERRKRLDKRNMAIMFTNWPGLNGGGKMEDLERFDLLPFKHKVVFTDEVYTNIKSAVCLKGLGHKNMPNKQVYATKSFLTGKRYIDQFDYIRFFNSILE